MHYSTVALLILIALVATGCASHPDPIVDLKGVNRQQFAEDWRECEAYAKEVDVKQGTARGAGLGAAVGAAAGAIGGNSDDVAEGAAYGGLYGGTRSGLRGDREQQLVFKRCLSGRGYRVLN